MNICSFKFALFLQIVILTRLPVFHPDAPNQESAAGSGEIK